MISRDMSLEIGLPAEQAKTILDFPFDAQGAILSEPGIGGPGDPRRKQERGKADDQSCESMHAVCGGCELAFDKHGGCGGNVRPYAALNPRRLAHYNWPQ